MPDRSLYERLNARANEVKSQRVTTEDTWQQIADNMLGRRDFVSVHTPGRQRNQRIYDDTSKVSGGLLSGAIHATMVSPAGKWFALSFEEPRLQDIAAAREWLALVEKRLYAAIRAPKANFHAQLSETFTDLINFGTGAIFVEDVPGQGIRFSTRPLQDLYLAEDPAGRVDTVVRCFKLTARQAVALWGGDAKAANRALGGSGAENRHDYMHIVVPREDHVVGNIDVTGKPWASFFLSVADRTVMDEGGYEEMPYALPRWEQDAGEVYGRGPGWNALSTQKMLNEMMKVTLTAAQKTVNPPMMVDSGGGVLPGDLVFHPNAIIPIDANTTSMNPPIQPLPFGGNFSITQSMIQDARQAVQSAFHHQLVETIRDPRMTATQVLELSAQMQRHLAPILGRLETELLEPIIERVFAIEARSGRLPPAPPELAGQPLKIDYVSPVARAQQTSDARAIIDFSGFASELSQAAPGVLDVVDFDAGMRDLADALGVPPTMIRDAREVATRRAAAAQQAAEDEAERKAVTATDQIAKLAKAVPAEAA